MNNISLTGSKVWKKLEKHFKRIKNLHIKDFFLKDSKRFNSFSIMFKNKILVDFSKNRIDSHAIKLLIDLSKELNLKRTVQDMFLGKKINYTENQPVLHTALRNRSNNSVVVDNKDVMLDIRVVLKKMKNFSFSVINGKWKGFTNKKITDVVNIGIGGSYLGPSMVVESLKEYKNHLNIHFISNIDFCNVKNVLNKINFETTIFLISSKTFTTKETITNATTVKNMFLGKVKEKKYLEKHFFALTANTVGAQKFGIIEENIFNFWSWVGGRYSLWSSVGLSIILSIGFENYVRFLDGAHDIDNHFLENELEENIPVILALISIWYNNFFNAETEAIIPYSSNMNQFVEYFQQTNMESNGKNVDTKGNKVNWQTGPIIWGGIGTNSQHAFFQLLHQGTKLIPSDFIIPIKKKNYLKTHDIQLLSNFLAQTKALAFGSNKKVFEKDNIDQSKIHDKEKQILNFKVFEGNQPSNSIVMDSLDPYNLGALIALYEHKTFVQGVILDIYSFDQWGVELGKNLAKDIENNFYKKNSFLSFDSSTIGLIKFCKDINKNS